MGIESASRLPSIRFQGCSPASLVSEPMMNTGVVPPPGRRHCVKPITIGTASVTPLIDKARNRSRSSSSEVSSKDLVPSGTIQRSAGACSIMVVTMRSKLRNSPVCTVTSTIEKTTPTIAATNRSLS